MAALFALLAEIYLGGDLVDVRHDDVLQLQGQKHVKISFAAVCGELCLYIWRNRQSPRWAPLSCGTPQPAVGCLTLCDSRRITSHWLDKISGMLVRHKACRHRGLT